jgi:uncharacterized protein (DUF488 family)
MTHEPETTVLTVGHSTRTLTEFTAILKAYDVELVVDVRTVPRSRHNPQFNKETLPDALKAEGIRYVHMLELGGLHRASNDTVNNAWRDKSFRGYADYMQTREFTEHLLKFIAFARENRVAVLCAEALPWRCHRILISDALTVRRIKVEHVLDCENKFRHELSPNALVEGTKITYPLYARETPQRALTDFGMS